MRTISLVLLGLAACNGGGTTMMEDETARCMMLCARVNTACMTSTDCTQFCDPHGTVYTACDPQVDPFLDCVDGQTTTTLCASANPCGAQMTALNACITAHPGDAGTAADAAH